MAKHELSNRELIEAIRGILAEDPRISEAQARSKVPCDKYRFRDAFRAVLVERGLARLAGGATIHPDFAPLIQIQLNDPLDLFRPFANEQLSEIDTEWVRLRAWIAAKLERVHTAARETIEEDRRRFDHLLAEAEARADEANRYAEELHRLHQGETGRFHAEFRELMLENARLIASVDEGRRTYAHLEARLAETVAERQHAMNAMDRALATNARLNRILADRRHVGHAARSRDLSSPGRPQRHPGSPNLESVVPSRSNRKRRRWKARYRR